MNVSALATFVFATVVVCVPNAVEAAPAEANCGLVTPPSSAGYVSVITPKSTMSLRVFPRLTDIPSDYTGCQVAWVSQTPDLSAIKIVRIYIVDGRAISIQPLPLDPMCKRGENSKETGCRYPAHFLAISSASACEMRPFDKSARSTECLTEISRERNLMEQYVLRAERENVP